MGIFVAQSQRTFENQGLILYNDWENNIPYWKESKQSEAFADKRDLFHTVNSWWFWGQAAQAQEHFVM